MSPISSNDYDYHLRNQTVLVICENDIGFEFQPTLNFNGPNTNCKSPRIPLTECELLEIIKSSKNVFNKEWDTTWEILHIYTKYIISVPPYWQGYSFLDRLCQKEWNSLLERNRKCLVESMPAFRATWSILFEIPVFGKDWWLQKAQKFVTW